MPKIQQVKSKPGDRSEKRRHEKTVVRPMTPSRKLTKAAARCAATSLRQDKENYEISTESNSIIKITVPKQPGKFGSKTSKVCKVILDKTVTQPLTSSDKPLRSINAEDSTESNDIIEIKVPKQPPKEPRSEIDTNDRKVDNLFNFPSHGAIFLTSAWQKKQGEGF